MFQRFTNSMQRFMFGRYGGDTLAYALLVFALVLSFLMTWLGAGSWSLIAYIPLAWAFFRMFSRNVSKRRAENQAFLKFWNPVVNFFKGIGLRFRERKTHKFFHCPNCRVTVRVPKGKGKLNITCPKCGNKFEKKT